MVRKRRLFVLTGILVVGLAVGSFALAGDKPLKPPKFGGAKTFSAKLIGYQETPLTLSTAGFGDFRAKLVNDTTLRYVLRFTDLEGGNVLFAHVHIGQRGTTGGVMFFLCGGGGKPACPNSPGVVEGTVTPANVIGPAGQGVAAGEFDEAIRAMRAGYAYANVHTVTYPTGEIRGQINSHSGEKHKQ
jgi:CHRD domain-containing protein